MAVTNETEFKEYVLRALGAPLLTVNVSGEQLDDRISEAISFFKDYYWDGLEREYLKHKVTQEDIDNRYITIPDHIWSINHVFTPSNSTNGQPNIFDLEYQLRMNDMRDLTSTSVIYYEQVMEHIALLQNRLNAERQFEFNRLNGKLHLHLNWITKVPLDSWIVVEAYAALDPSTSPKMWNDRLFKEYAIALTKFQWAQNLSKYQNVQLPGGVTVDSVTMYNNAQEDISKIEQEIMVNLAPLNWFMG